MTISITKFSTAELSELPLHLPTNSFLIMNHDYLHLFISHSLIKRSAHTCAAVAQTSVLLQQVSYTKLDQVVSG